MLPWTVFTLASPAILVAQGRMLHARTGVQQGDPLGPLLFCLGLHSVVADLVPATAPGLSWSSWYMDDGQMVGTPDALEAALQTLAARCPTVGLRLNVAKCERYGPGRVPGRRTPR